VPSRLKSYLSRKTNTFSTSSPGQAPGKKFSTFAGVFTPSILTILGVIMFMRAGFVVGQAGIFQALVILGLGKLLTTLTSFSISAIASNTEVKGGGAYYLISRTLGPEFGGAIGLAFFFAQALSVPFYVLGFAESVVLTFPFLKPFFGIIALMTAAVLFYLSYKGAGSAIKVQYFIMAILGLSIIAFLGGAALHFSPVTFKANWGFNPESPLQFWPLFAIYFPAVTGIMAGVNMSGDLKNPSRSIPLGTFCAVGIGLLIYTGQMLLMGGAADRARLIAEPYRSLMSVVPFHMGFLVTLGVFAATLSSAIGSFLGAPRILQSLGRDKLLRPLNPFAASSAAGEPVRALGATGVITGIVIVLSRNGSEGGALNIVAAIVSMLFLWTYGITNLAAFVESFGRNPSFRPRFRLFHWMIPLTGFVGCAGVMLLIDVRAALAAVTLVAALFLYVRKHVLSTSFGDARRGFFYSRVRDNLFTLAQLPMHPKNWRPTITVLGDNAQTRLTQIHYADWLGCGSGIITLASLIPGRLATTADRRREELAGLHRLIDERKLRVFPEVVVSPDIDEGLTQFLQATSIGPIKPNVAMFGLPSNPERATAFARHLQTATQLAMSLVLVNDGGLPQCAGPARRIDLWWRGEKNGSLMMILAYLLSRNAEWAGSTIRMLRIVPVPEEKEPVERQTRAMVDRARMDIAIVIIESAEPFQDLLRRYSRDTTVVFAGFRIPDEASASGFLQHWKSTLNGLPTTLLVHSSGDADLTA
jgi:amino acid transporter